MALAEVVKSKCVRRPSSVRPSVRPSHGLQQTLRGLSSPNLVSMCLLAISPDHFFFFQNFEFLIFYEFFQILNTLEYMGVKKSNRFSSYKYSWILLKLIMQIPHLDPYKSYHFFFRNSKILNFYEFLQILNTLKYMGVKISNRFSSYKYGWIVLKLIMHIPEVNPHKSYHFFFRNSKILNFYKFFQIAIYLCM